MKKFVVGALLTLFSINMITLAFNVRTVKALVLTITVPDDYLTIQEAINHANSGDTINVKAGTYYENNIIVNKSLVLMGDNRGAIIDGNLSGCIISIEAWNVTLDGFTVRNGGDHGSGISVLSSETKLINNNITNNWNGIFLYNTSYNIILSNSITGNLNGITADWLSDSAIDANSITDNILGINLGYYASRNTIYFNYIRNNWDAGIFIETSYQNTIEENNILLNNQGNSSSAIVIGQSSFNKFFHNNIINRGKQMDVATGQVNTWDDGYPSGGNYWSDYAGVDEKSGPNQDQLGSDGIGDAPCTIAAENEDRYPLMHPYPIPVSQLNSSEYYELLANSANYSSLLSELNDLQSKYSSLKNELYITTNIMYALFVTTMILIGATVYATTIKPKVKSDGSTLATKLKGSISVASQRIAAIMNSNLEKISLRSTVMLFASLTVVDIAQTLWAFPNYEVGIIAKMFIIFFGDWGWLYFPFRIIITLMIVILSHDYVTPDVSKKLFVALSLITLAAVIWNVYSMIAFTSV
jgi:parallel beta-helix repeat protein